MPYYFSGTNSVAKGWVWTDDGILTDLWFYLDGILMKEWHYDGGNIVVFEGGLKVTFDSSHFPNGTSLQVKIKGRNSSGAVAEATGYAPVNNRVVGFNHPEFWHPGKVGTNELVAQMNWLNYNFYIQTNNWGPAEITYGLASASIYYVNSHGSQNTHYTAFSNQENEESYIFADILSDTTLNLNHNYEYYRSALNGSGTPPNNSSAVPPIHFAQLDFCESGGSWYSPPPGSNLFSTLLIPCMDFYWPGQWCPNQAVLTWKAYTDAWTTENDVWWIFSEMKLGKTAKQARDKMIQYSSASMKQIRISPTGDPGSFVYLTPDMTSRVPVWGDHNTRIKGAYTNSVLLPSTFWWY